MLKKYILPIALILLCIFQIVHANEDGGPDDDSSGSIEPIHANIKILGDDQIYRGHEVLVKNFITLTGGSPGDNLSLWLRPPKEFEKLVLGKNNYSYPPVIDKNIVKTVLVKPGKTRSVTYLEYSALISKKYPPTEVILDPKNKTQFDFREDMSHNIIDEGIRKIVTQNCAPNITSFNSSSGRDYIESYLGNKTKVFCKGYDDDDENLTWKLYDNAQLLSKNNTSDNYVEFEYTAQSPGKHELSVQVYDAKENDSSDKVITIQVKNETFSQHRNQALQSQWWQYIGWTIILAVIGFFSLVIMPHIKYQRYMWVIGLLWLVIILLILPLTTLFIQPIRYSPVFELIVYFIILLFSEYFILNNFHNESTINLPLWKQYGFQLGFTCNLGIFLLMLLFSYIYHYPAQSSEGLKYFSDIIITLSGIFLPIIATFIVWYMDKESFSDDIKNQGKNCILLYFLIMLFSIIGILVGSQSSTTLVDWTKISYLEIESPLIAISIISSESTFLLIVPVFIFTYSFISWILGTKKKNTVKIVKKIRKI